MEKHDDISILRRKLEGRPPTIVEFLEERLRDAEYTVGRLLDQISDEPVVINMKALIIGIRGAIRIHSQWPVLVHEEPQFETTEFARPTDPVVMTMSQRMMWLTQEEYIKRFGTEPPTTPILKQMARAFQSHSDFNPEWLN